jgi:hypothetical protein
MRSGRSKKTQGVGSDTFERQDTAAQGHGAGILNEQEFDLFTALFVLATRARSSGGNERSHSDATQENSALH